MIIYVTELLVFMQDAFSLAASSPCTLTICTVRSTFGALDCGTVSICEPCFAQLCSPALRKSLLPGTLAGRLKCANKRLSGTWFHKSKLFWRRLIRAARKDEDLCRLVRLDLLARLQDQNSHDSLSTHELTGLVCTHTHVPNMPRIREHAEAVL